MPRTRDQRRAGLVFENVRHVEGAPIHKKYGALCLSAATLVRTAGLVQALAFYKAKNEAHHQRLLDHLETELRDIGMLAGDSDLLNQVIQSDLVAYMRLTQETIALCQWHKRFAQSVLKAEPGEE